MGDDMYGTFVKVEMERYGVNTSCVKVNPGLTFHSVVLLNVSNSSRTCVWNRGEAAAPTVEDVDLDVLKQAKYLHLDGNQLDCAISRQKRPMKWASRSAWTRAALTRTLKSFCRWWMC